jgi:hypothetical protein
MEWIARITLPHNSVGIVSRTRQISLSRRLHEWRLLFGAGSDFEFSPLRVGRMFEKRRFHSTETMTTRDRPGSSGVISRAERDLHCVVQGCLDDLAAAEFALLVGGRMSQTTRKPQSGRRNESTPQ